MFEALVQMIVEHPKYGPAMQGAVAGNARLVLNYHNHLGESSYCVSICAREHNPVKLLDTGEETLEELAHIRGFGKGEADCVPLTKAFSEALCNHYKIERPPDIYLNAKPLPASFGDSEESGS
jgi:hypothetical protein